MSSESFIVANIKCAGCVKTIEEGLRELPGVSAVEVDIATGRVSVEGSGLVRATLGARLAELGYPET
jgi:copper chaperone CopZ